MANPIDQGTVKKYFEYLHGTGEIAWRYNPDKGHWWNARNVGKIAGSISRVSGYKQVGIDKKKYLVHRVIWTHFNGAIPDGMVVDHIDRNRRNNRIENLRLLTIESNLRNCDRWDRWTSTGVWGGNPSNPWPSALSSENRIPFLMAEFEAARDGVILSREALPVPRETPKVDKQHRRPVRGERVQYRMHKGVFVAHVVIEGRLYPLRDGQDPTAFRETILAASRSLNNATRIEEEGEAA